MATAKALFFLGFVFLSCNLIGVSGVLELRGSFIPIIPNEGPAIFDVTKFGAVADDMTDNIDAFRAAWGQACKNSTIQAKVLIPAGTFRAAQTMFAGPCTSPKPITVEVIGTIKANTDLSEYVSPEWFTFLEIDGFVLTGKGVFDGQGAVSWPFNDCRQTNGNCAPLPSVSIFLSLKFDKVNNSMVTNITSLNSMQFHFHLHGCNNISLFNLNITAPGNSPNTDGIHISSSNGIKVFSSIIGTGDDCISIGHSTSNITITDITCGPGHGISVGSLGKRPEERSVNGVTVTNCTFVNTTNGARIKTWMGMVPAEAKNITYEGLIMNGVQNPIVIDQSYGSKTLRTASTSVWKISDIHFRKIKGTTVSNVAVSLQCSILNPCEGVEIADVDLAYAGRLANTTFISSCLNAKAIFGGILNPPAC
ncbi:Exopolygalacturonase, partial [Mucuna pruriens]